MKLEFAPVIKIGNSTATGTSYSLSRIPLAPSGLGQGPRRQTHSQLLTDGKNEASTCFCVVSFSKCGFILKKTKAKHVRKVYYYKHHSEKI